MNFIKSSCFKLSLSILLFVSSIAAKSQSPASLQELQADFIGLRFGVMLHFNMGTFTNEEWAKPNQDTKLFNPTTLDCNQWAEACASAGMKYAILTTKHHDGFCLWDSKYTDYDVANSPYKKDVVRAYVDAFRKQGIAPCLYFSVWDKHNGVENGGLVEEEFILNQLTELLTQYGPIPMIIFDGWNWKMGHRKISYQRIYNHVKKLQPNCLVSEHNGNSNFQTDLIYYEGPKGVFPPGNNVFASQMALTMTDGWFWHESSPKNVKDEQYALDKLQRLEPLYCNFMLNIAPNRAGLFDQKVVETLHKIGQLWSPNSKRLPLPIQPLNMTSFLEPVGIVASAGWAFSQPALPANDGTPIAALLQEQTAQVMVDGCSDEISDNGGFSAFQTCWKFEKLTTSPQLTLDMGAVKEFSKLFYVPARWLGYEGVVTKFRISTSVDNKTFTVTHEGKWQKDTALKVSYFKPVAARYVRIELLESIGDPIVSEIGVGN